MWKGKCASQSSCFLLPRADQFLGSSRENLIKLHYSPSPGQALNLNKQPNTNILETSSNWEPLDPILQHLVPSPLPSGGSPVRPLAHQRHLLPPADQGFLPRGALAEVWGLEGTPPHNSACGVASGWPCLPSTNFSLLDSANFSSHFFLQGRMAEPPLLPAPGYSTSPSVSLCPDHGLVGHLL